MSDERERVRVALARLARLEERLGGRACLVGGAALIARAFVRATRDLDVIVAASEWDVDRLLVVAREVGYATDAVDRELADVGILRVAAPEVRGMPVDLILADAPFLDEVLRRASPVDVGGSTLLVATLEDLVLLKLDAHRPRDIDDVLAIKDAAADQLDRAYLERWATELGVLDRLRLYLDSPET